MKVTVEFNSMKELKEFVNGTYVIGQTKTEKPETTDAPKRRGRPPKKEV